MMKTTAVSTFSRILFTMICGAVMIGSMSAASTSPALKNYVYKDDGAFTWSERGKAETDDVTVYDLALTSQKWRDMIWKHQLTLVVPKKMKSPSTVLLFVTGGSNNKETGEPNWNKLDSGDFKRFAQVATACQAPAAVLRQTPNQPLFGDLHEDEIISLTFDKYLDSGDETWPLLLPMVKSAVRAMDALQAFGKKDLDLNFEKFVVSGASKRGWTTWLTGAAEPRVAAIAPMVIDVLNMKPQMDYQLDAWGEYSVQIQDYTEKGIQEKMNTDKGAGLRAIVDPYSYLDSLTMPKLIFIGTNDPYWPVDAIKFYFNDLPEPKFIHYVPNVGHDLGDGEQAIRALAAFFAEQAQGVKHPAISWEMKPTDEGLMLSVSADSTATGVRLWETTSTDRDFRNNLWLEHKIKAKSSPIEIPVPSPKKGFRALYAEVEFPSLAGGSYTKCTRVYVMDQNGPIDR